MAKYQFVDFVPTPTEKHVGIISVRIHGDPISLVRYKIVARKDGTGHFPNIASYKMPNRMPGEEYDESWMPEMRSDYDQLVKFIVHSYNEWVRAQQPSVFTPQPVAQHQQQPNPNYRQDAPQQSVPFIQRPEYQPSFNDMPPDMPPINDQNLPF
jgi:hypothetical protein